jgi:hypothetical protein
MNQKGQGLAAPPAGRDRLVNHELIAVSCVQNVGFVGNPNTRTGDVPTDDRLKVPAPQEGVRLESGHAPVGDFTGRDSGRKGHVKLTDL